MGCIPVAKRGVSQIIAAVVLSAIALSAVMMLYPTISSHMSRQVYSVSVLSSSLMKQESYLLLSVNVKNTGSAPVVLECRLYDENGQPHLASPAPAAINPGATVSFIYENSSCTGFLVGNEYRVDLCDNSSGIYRVNVLCLGR